MSEAAGAVSAEKRDGRGRCAVAQRALAAGTTVVSELPWAAALLEAERSRRCDYSLRPAETRLQRCAVTGLGFRGREEQRSAWLEYYREEHQAAQVRAQEEGGGERRRLPAPARLAARALWRSLRESAAPWRDLVNHWDSLGEKQQAELFAEGAILRREVIRGLKASAGLGTLAMQLLDSAAVARLLAAVAVNAMTVADEEQRAVGLGLYPRGALLNHGEEPNCAQSFLGRRLIIRTVKPVAAGEELTIPYAELAEASCVRRAWFREQYYFDPAPGGTVPSSVDARDAVLAEVWERGTAQGPWRRSSQSAAWNAHHGVLVGWPRGPTEGSTAQALVRRVHDEWSAARGAVKAGDARAGAEHLQAAWAAASGDMLRLGDGHELRLAVAREAMDVSMELERWDDALAWARIVCAGASLVYAPEWPVVALGRARLAKLELYHGHFRLAAEAGEAALRTLAVSYEAGAEIFAELRQIVAQARAEAEAELRALGPGAGGSRQLGKRASAALGPPLPPPPDGAPPLTRPVPGACGVETLAAGVAPCAPRVALHELD